MICGAWLLSVSTMAVFLFGGFGTFTFNFGAILHLPHFYNQTAARIFGGFCEFMFIVFPLSITTVCYWKVYQTVKQHNASVAPNLNAGPVGSSSVTLSKEEIHITYSLLAVVCGFVLCWIPSSTVLHISIYTNLSRHAGLVILYTCYASSAINPLVYNTFNKPFRREFLRIFHPSLLMQSCCCCKRDTTDERPQ